MNFDLRVACCRILSAIILCFVGSSPLAAEPLPLKRAVELALAHSTTAAVAGADQQHALASYHEARNQYLPQLMVGSGLGASWGFPLSLEGSAPSLFSVTSQSALFNPALHDFVRAAKTEWRASATQSKDQRNQVIQDTVLSYAELRRWEDVLTRLQQEQTEAVQSEQNENARIQEGVDAASELNKAKLVTARVRYWMAEAQGAADVLRERLAHLTGLPAASIETVAESIPPLPEVQTEGDPIRAENPAVQAAEQRAEAQQVRARGEHRALWPSVDFAAQYAVLARYNNYDEFFKTFQRNNATVGVVLRFPFLNPAQHAHAQAADAEALRAKKEAEAARNQGSEEKLKLQRAVEQVSAARDVANLEFQVAQSNFDAVQTRINSGVGTQRDLEAARHEANTRYRALLDAEFELQKTRISWLRANGQLEDWALGGH